MSQPDLQSRLRSDGVVLLDGGTGTELERRGASMDPEAWCGPATLENLELLEAVHRDYIAAGADIITANTYASSRLMLEAAGVAGSFEAINRGAMGAARRARAAGGRHEVAVAGSLSHMVPVVRGAAHSDLDRLPSDDEMAAAFGELAGLLREEGCDLILLEMMHHPDRMRHAFKAAVDTGLPVWAGFSARSGPNGELLSFSADREVPFEETVAVLADFEVAAAGIMHTPSNLVGEALAILREVFDGPLTAYPDSGYFKMPHWQFEDVIPPADFRRFAEGWIAQGARVVGGCCGLSPEHIAALAPLKAGA